MVLGCGRSGTSIFGELFQAIEGYAYASEPPFHAVLDADYSRPQAFKVPREPLDRAPTPGLSVPLGLLRDRVPRMVYFWIVRHPLDTICSLRVGIAQNWGHHPRPPDWQDWLDRPLEMRCAYHWAWINQVGFGHIRPFAHVVRFEDMLADPAAFAAHVGTVLAADIGGPQVRAWIDRVQNTNNVAFVEAQTSRSYSRSDHAVRVGRWRENLDADQVRLVSPIVAKGAALHGYALPEAG